MQVLTVRANSWSISILSLSCIAFFICVKGDGEWEWGVCKLQPCFNCNVQNL